MITGIKTLFDRHETSLPKTFQETQSIQAVQALLTSRVVYQDESHTFTLENNPKTLIPFLGFSQQGANFALGSNKKSQFCSRQGPNLVCASYTLSADAKVFLITIHRDHNFKNSRTFRRLSHIGVTSGGLSISQIHC